MWLVEETHEYLDKHKLYSSQFDESDSIDIAFALNTNGQPEGPICVVREEGSKKACAPYSWIP